MNANQHIQEAIRQHREAATYELRGLLREAVKIIDTMNANAQGQDRASVSDPLSQAVAEEFVARVRKFL